MGANELVQSIYRAFNSGDVPTVMGALRSDVVWRTPPTLPWSDGTYEGRDGVLRYFEAFGAALEAASVDPEVVEGEGSVVVARGYERATARATGRAFAARFVHVWHVTDDGVASMEGLADTATVCDAFVPG